MSYNNFLRDGKSQSGGSVFGRKEWGKNYFSFVHHIIQPLSVTRKEAGETQNQIGKLSSKNYLNPEVISKSG